MRWWEDFLALHCPHLLVGMRQTVTLFIIFGFEQPEIPIWTQIVDNIFMFLFVYNGEGAFLIDFQSGSLFFKIISSRNR